MGVLALAWSRIRNVTSGRLLGRITSGTGRAEELTPAQVRSLCSVYSTSEVDAIASAKVSAASLALGTTGSDLNWSGATLHVPDAGASARGVVTTGTQTFSGAKTFSGSITANGGITSPHTSYPNNSEQFGYGATTGDGGLAVGRNANGWPNGAGTAIGTNSVSDYASVSVGYGATSGWQGVAVGFGTFTLDGYGVGGTALGKSATVLHDGSVSLGNGATSTAVQQFQIGSAGAPIVQQRFHTNGGSLTFANETGTFLTVANAGSTTFAKGMTIQSGHFSVTSSTGAISFVDGWNYANPTYPGVYIESAHNMRLLVANGSHSAGNGNMIFEIGPVVGDTYGKFIWKSGYGTEVMTLQRSAGVADLRVLGALTVSSTLTVSSALTVSGALNFPPITKAALLVLTPTSATAGRWRVTDATPASREAYPDGTNWRYTSDDTIVV